MISKPVGITFQNAATIEMLVVKHLTLNGDTELEPDEALEYHFCRCYQASCS